MTWIFPATWIVITWTLAGLVAHGLDFMRGKAEQSDYMTVWRSIFLGYIGFLLVIIIILFRPVVYKDDEQHLTPDYMKDIQKLSMWPTLKKEGFETKVYKSVNTTIGRGAVLTVDNSPKIEIKPLLNGKWQLEVNNGTSATQWEGTPFAIKTIVIDQILKLKEAMEI